MREDTPDAVDWFSGISNRRALNAFVRLNLNSRKEVADAVLSGRLSPKPQSLGGTWLYGIKAHQDVCRWLGLPVPTGFNPPKVCRHCGGIL